MGNSVGAGSSKCSVLPEQDPDQQQLLKAAPPVLGVGNLPPEQWQPIAKLKGSGQCEYQGFESWTPEEQQQWQEGKLRAKWGIGQVSIRLPIQSCMQFTGLAYGYLPFIIPIWWAIWMASSWAWYGSPRFFPTYGLCIAVGFALVNELITKQICKRVLPATITNRPPEAVCKHPGMPSGHVMNAQTIMVWVFLEALMDESIYVEWLLIIVMILGPVPWARVYNKDHTVPQVLVSGVIATFMGILAFWIQHHYYGGHTFPWNWYHVGEGYGNPYPYAPGGGSAN